MLAYHLIILVGGTGTHGIRNQRAYGTLCNGEFRSMDWVNLTKFAFFRRRMGGNCACWRIFTTPFGVRMELVAPHHFVRVSYTEADYATLHLERVRFAVSDLLDCEQFFAETLGEEALNQLEFESLDDRSTFRPVEVQLSSPTKEKTWKLRFCRELGGSSDVPKGLNSLSSTAKCLNRAIPPLVIQLSVPDTGHWCMRRSRFSKTHAPPCYRITPEFPIHPAICRRLLSLPANRCLSVDTFS